MDHSSDDETPVSQSEVPQAPPALDDEEDAAPAVEMIRRNPVQVPYCPICTFPAEYCEYSGRLEECLPWVQEQLAKQGEEHVALSEKGKKQRKKAADVGEGVEKILPGGKIKFKEDKAVLISTQHRTKGKSVTVIAGAELFGVDLTKTAKDLKKRLSCGVAVVKTPAGKDQIEIQGDFVAQILQMMPEKFPTVPREVVFCMEDKQKVPAFA
eukprot:TRINITY_DN8219_c0_g1_i1.p1 TRINITY_DN8219_c0_g1~~TRINITY_DN8219_c0_g1_i1.p1  ORF type:complete len:211 (-),score=51.11 TRINITY_DN8219_c0_g1_i1:14-646(-)